MLVTEPKPSHSFSQFVQDLVVTLSYSKAAFAWAGFAISFGSRATSEKEHFHRSLARVNYENFHIVIQETNVAVSQIAERKGARSVMNQPAMEIRDNASMHEVRKRIISSESNPHF